MDMFFTVPDTMGTVGAEIFHAPVQSCSVVGPVTPKFVSGLWGCQWVTWWTIGMLLLTNFLTIYIHFSHALAGVITTSLTVLYLPSNPLQPHSVACASFRIITKLLTLICRQFSWPYSC